MVSASSSTHCLQSNIIGYDSMHAHARVLVRMIQAAQVTASSLLRYASVAQYSSITVMIKFINNRFCFGIGKGYSMH